MATNTRTFKAQRCAIQNKAVAVNGVTTIQVRSGFGTHQEAPIDGLLGGAIVDRSREMLSGSLQTQDVSKIVSILSTAAAASGMIFYTAESGLGTFQNTILCPTLAEIALLFHSANLTSRAEQFSTLNCQFEANFLDSTKGNTDARILTANVAAATMDIDVPYAVASRLMGPTSFSYDQGPVVPAHPVAFNLNIAGALARSFDEQWLGNIVDLVGYALSGSITFGEATVATGDDIAQDLLDAAIGGALTVLMRDAGLATTASFVLSNVTFGGQVSVDYNANTGHHEFTLPFKMHWDGTLKTLAQLIAIT